jgi:AraC-like DNA-binding protein
MHSRSSGKESAAWDLPDPTSAVLVDLRLSGTFFCNSAFADRWSVEIAERDFASFHFVAAGECWLQTTPRGGRTETVALRPGDLALLPRSPRQVFSSDKRKTGTPLDELPARRLTDSASALRVGAGAKKWLVVCGGVRLQGFAATTLVDLLPEVVVLRADDADRIVAGALESMRQESMAARVGSALLMTRLADVVVIHAIRSWIEQADPTVGWLAALRDPQLGRAIAAIHRSPERAWSAEALARVAGLSRSRFSDRFTDLVGTAPMQYLTKLRMDRARDLLRGQKVSIAELAGRFGYDSEPAFSRAFKRHIGQPPGAIRGSNPLSPQHHGSHRHLEPRAAESYRRRGDAFARLASRAAPAERAVAGK